MKLIIAAITMMIATPAFAQNAAPADAHSQRTSHEGHEGHEGHDMSDGCCDKDAEGKMGCCEKMKAKGKATPPSEAPAADPHAGHGTDQH
ncbi:hypothetical protein [Sphingobium xenophagum]|jgi:hypothetical protein